MRRRACCLAWLGAAASLPKGTCYAPNPPRCATDITGLLASFSGAAKRITWASDECMLGWTQAFSVGIDYTAPPSELFDMPAECSIDVCASLKDFIKAAKFMTKAAFVCGNLDTGCAQQVLSSMVNVAAVAQYVSEATYNCQLSRLWCVGGAADVAVSAVLLVQNVQTGLELCSGITNVPPLPPGYEEDPDAEAEPGAPQPEPDQPGATPAPQLGDSLQSSFFPGMAVGPAERRLSANSSVSLDAKVVEVARQRQRELGTTLERLRLQLRQAVRRAELGHALQGQQLPEPLQRLEGRLENATAEAARRRLQPVTPELMEEQMAEVPAKLKDLEVVAKLASSAPLMV